MLVGGYVPGRELTVGILGRRALPVVEIIPEDGWAAHDGIGGDKVYTLDATIRYIPFEDPGRYEMLVSGRTTGTPYTGAVSFNYNGGVFEVFLIETALIK